VYQIVTLTPEKADVTDQGAGVGERIYAPRVLDDVDPKAVGFQGCDHGAVAADDLHLVVVVSKGLQLAP
jgi:hypothetical protein